MNGTDIFWGGDETPEVSSSLQSLSNLSFAKNSQGLLLKTPPSNGKNNMKRNVFPTTSDLEGITTKNVDNKLHNRKKQIDEDNENSENPLDIGSNLATHNYYPYKKTI